MLTEPEVWKPILAGFINTTLVLVLVQLCKAAIPSLRSAVPWLIPVIAGALGPLVAVGQSWLGTWLGIPVDLSPVVAVFTGATATAVHQVGKQLS